MPTLGLGADPDLRWAFGFVRPHWRTLTLVLGLSLLSTVLTLAMPYLSQRLIDRALVGRDFHELWTTLGWFLVISLASYVVNVVSGLLYTRTSASVLFDMRLSVYSHLQALSPRYYARTRLGDIVARLNNDVGEIQRIAAETLLAWVSNVLFLVGTVVAMAWLDVRLFAASLLPLPFALWALMRYRRRLSERVSTLRQASADIGSFLIETLQGMKLVVASNAQARERERFRHRNATFVDALMKMQRTSYLSGGLPGLLLSVGTMLVFAYGGWRVIAGSLTLGTLVAFVAYQMRMLGPVQGMMGLYTNLATVRVSVGRVREILSVAPDVVEHPAPRSLPTCRGEVEFRDVSFTFERGVATLDRVSFHVRPGERVAVVGPSGAGKSTIAELLRRFLDPGSGAVRLDGVDLRDYAMADVRRHIVQVDQEPFFLHASIAENLRYARATATDEDIRVALAAAGLSTFVAGLPQRLETVIGERGVTMSVGERQRLAVARAMLADPAVLILDEATAALDPVSEALVTRGYEAAMEGRSTILITHRLHLALHVDRVFVLQDARIVEAGPPDELLATGGAFAELFRAQLKTAESASR
ncbi:MAG: ABC transporter ATP-binding protein [Vicinamibacterales bacterium]